MDEQTRKLLEECTSGCRMASDSMKQIREYIKDTSLLELVDSYTERHDKLRQTNVSGNAVMSPKSREQSPVRLHGLLRK